MTEKEKMLKRNNIIKREEKKILIFFNREIDHWSEAGNNFSRVIALKNFPMPFFMQDGYSHQMLRFN